MAQPSKLQNNPRQSVFFNALNAHQQTEAMKAAVELDVFAAIAEGKDVNYMPKQILRLIETFHRLLLCPGEHADPS